jgi:Mlc titration factor MtfA (ptsG expression regulator)
MDSIAWLLVLVAAGTAITALATLAGRSARLRSLLAWLAGPSFHARRLARRRRRLLAMPFPADWEGILCRNLGLYARLAAPEQEQLKKIVRVLVAEKEWTGCKGLAITDEVRVTIAGAAAVLILGREHDYYQSVRSILVYPTTFEMPAREHLGGGFVLEGRQHLLGQAWYRGPILLAWDEVLRDCRHPAEGRNVVLHEFAHQLDYEGAPASGGDESHWRRFGRVMQAEYEALVYASVHGRATLLDSYGAASPAEFFAVATECFFGQPVPLRQRHPRLYEVLRDFYHQGPAGAVAS